MSSRVALSSAKRPHQRAREDAGVVSLLRVLRRAEAEARRQKKSLKCELCARPGEPPIPIGDDNDPSFTPWFRLTVRDDRVFRERITGLSLGRAYVTGALDIDVYGTDEVTKAKNLMSVFELREGLRSGTPITQAVGLAAELAFSPPTSVNARAIQRDYNLETEFYHRFLDTKYHLYSQCRFGPDQDMSAPDKDISTELADPETALNAAAKSKLDHVWKKLALPDNHGRPLRILDIGAGWGGVTEYVHEGGKPDVHVTSLTLSEAHKAYVEDRNRERKRDDEVLLEDFLRHFRRGYDAIVILGVIEHIPNYRLFCARAWEALKPGGRLYLDASATKEKYALSAFTRRYTWHGPHSCLVLPDLLEELVFHGFTLLSVDQDSHDYHRTMRAWARRLDMNHDAIAGQWGENVYRAFRVFLWGGAHGFKTDRLQSYTLVAERGRGSGPRPSRLRRTGQFLASIR